MCWRSLTSLQHIQFHSYQVQPSSFIWGMILHMRDHPAIGGCFSPSCFELLPESINSAQSYKCIKVWFLHIYISECFSTLSDNNAAKTYLMRKMWSSNSHGFTVLDDRSTNVGAVAKPPSSGRTWTWPAMSRITIADFPPSRLRTSIPLMALMEFVNSGWLTFPPMPLLNNANSHWTQVSSDY